MRDIRIGLNFPLKIQLNRFIVNRNRYKYICNENYCINFIYSKIFLHRFHIMNTIFKLNSHTKSSNYPSRSCFSIADGCFIEFYPTTSDNQRSNSYDEKGVRNPFPWTRHHGQTTRPRVFSGFPVTMSEIAAEMRVKGGGVVTYQSRR